MLLAAFFSSTVQADGIGLPPTYQGTFTRLLSEPAQLAYIDFDGEHYNTTLYVEMDFRNYSHSQLIWVVPFESAPTNISFEASSMAAFERKVGDFDAGLNDSLRLNSVLGTLGENELLYALFMLPPPIPYLGACAFLGVFGVFSPGSSRGATASGAYSQGTYDFGGLGSAEVFKVTDSPSFSEFLASKGAQVPPEMAQYTNMSVVVFTINRRQSKLSALAEFEFDSNGTIFFPSGTTQYLQNGRADKMMIRLRTPKDYEIVSNIPDSLQQTSDYFVYYGRYYGRSHGAPQFPEPPENMTYRQTGEQVHDYSHSYFVFDARNSPELYKEDLRITAVPEKQGIPLGWHFAPIITNPYVLLPTIAIFAWFVTFMLVRNSTKKLQAATQGLGPGAFLAYSFVFSAAVFLLSPAGLVFAVTLTLSPLVNMASSLGLISYAIFEVVLGVTLILAIFVPIVAIALLSKYLPSEAFKSRAARYLGKGMAENFTGFAKASIVAYFLVSVALLVLIPWIMGIEV